MGQGNIRGGKSKVAFSTNFGHMIVSSPGTKCQEYTSPVTECPDLASDYPSPATECPSLATVDPSPATEFHSLAAEHLCSTTEEQDPITIDPRRSTEGSSPSTLDPGPCTKHPSPATIDPCLATEDPSSTRRDPSPSIVDPSPDTVDPGPATVDQGLTRGDPSPAIVDQGSTRGDPSPSIVDPSPDTIDQGSARGDPSPAIVDPGPDTEDQGSTRGDPSPAIVDPSPDTVDQGSTRGDPSPSIVDPSPDTVDQGSTRGDPSPSIVDPSPDTVDPCWTRGDPSPSIVDPSPDTVDQVSTRGDPSPSIVDPNPATVDQGLTRGDPSPDTVDPCWTRGDPSPSIVDPSPDTVDPCWTRGDPSPSIVDPSPDTEDQGSTRGDPSPSIVDPGPDTVNPCWTRGDPSPAIVDPGPATVDQGLTRGDPSPAIVDPCWTRGDLSPSIVDPGPDTEDQGSTRGDPSPAIVDPSPATVDPCWTRGDPSPAIVDPGPATVDPCWTRGNSNPAIEYPGLATVYLSFSVDGSQTTVDPNPYTVDPSPYTVDPNPTRGDSSPVPEHLSPATIYPCLATVDPDSTRGDSRLGTEHLSPSAIYPCLATEDPNSTRRDSSPRDQGSTRGDPSPSIVDPSPATVDQGSTRGDPSPDTVDPGLDTVDQGSTRGDPSPAIVDPGPATLDPCWTRGDPSPSIVDPGPATVDPCWTRGDPSPSIVDPGPATVDPCWTRGDPSPAIVDPGPDTVDPCWTRGDPSPAIVDPGPATVDPCWTRGDPSPSIVDPGPATVDPCWTRGDPSPSIVDPGPATVDPCWTRGNSSPAIEYPSRATEVPGLATVFLSITVDPSPTKVDPSPATVDTSPALQYPIPSTEYPDLPTVGSSQSSECPGLATVDQSSTAASSSQATEYPSPYPGLATVDPDSATEYPSRPTEYPVQGMQISDAQPEEASNEEMNDSGASQELEVEEQVPDSNSDDSDVIPFMDPCGFPAISKCAADSTSCDTCDKGHNSGSTGEKQGIVVQTVVEGSSKRDYTKKHACFFCGKSVMKMARHLEYVHNDVEELGKLQKMSKKDRTKEQEEIRKQVFTKYRNLGDFNHNVEVLLKKEGVFYVGRRPATSSTKLDASAYTPCPMCLTFFVKNELWRHVKHCPFKDEKINPQTSEKTRTYTDCAKSGEYLLLGALGTEVFHVDGDIDQYNELITKRFHSDEISRTVKSDKLLFLYGITLLRKLGIQRASQVREKLRILGRLKIELRSLSEQESADIGCFISGKNFDLCMKSIRNLMGESNETSVSGTKTCKKPSLALKAGQFLAKIASLKRGQAIRNHDIEGKDEADSFLTLYREEFNHMVSSVAHHTLMDRKLNQKAVLPLTEDLMKYMKYLEANMVDLTTKVLDQPNHKNWNDLSEITLARILCFNKRRSNEPSKMTVEQYRTRPVWGEHNQELVATLKPIERTLMKDMTLVEVVGKCFRRVPVLLTRTMTAAVDALILQRERGEVQDPNPYVFAQGQSNFKCGSFCIRRTALAAQLQYPERVTTTKMRKYLATVSQIFNLTTIQLEELARHMGHELSVHRQYYRLQDDVIELAKVSRLLLAVEEGRAAKFAGCTLDDINLGDIEAPEEPEDEPDEPEVEGNGEMSAHGEMIDDAAPYEQPCPPDPVEASACVHPAAEKKEKHDRIKLKRSYSPEHDGATGSGAGPADHHREREERGASITSNSSGGHRSHYHSPEDSPRHADERGYGKRKRVKRTEWSFEQKDSIRIHLLPLVEENKKPPTKEEIMDVKSKVHILQERSWQAIKYQAWSMFQQTQRKRQKITGELLSN